VKRLNGDFTLLNQELQQGMEQEQVRMKKLQCCGCKRLQGKPHLLLATVIKAKPLPATLKKNQGENVPLGR
jgi:hypothetical protein